MDALKEDLAGLEIGASTASVQKYLESQKELFHSQIDHLQRIVVTQCKLTGVNPLSQEMAAGAMSIKIGKRPRDLLNPKAVKYMQAVFSIKDSISKKECREISAQFGVTVTQVRDFFNSQRSRVRKLVWLSSEKAARATARKGAKDEVGTSDSMNAVDPVPLNSVAPGLAASDSIGAFAVPLKTVGSIPVPLNSVDPHVVPLGSVEHGSGTINSAGSDHIPLNSIGPSGAEAPSCSVQDDTLAGIDGSDKHFVENIFNLLRKEETFSGQVKLMQWILQMQTPCVLNWFLVKGGVSILATWLSIAAAEEQTSFLLIVLKVFCHLPLRNALPEHMSAILQSVNKLRFYRMPDISNRARVLLSKWSKMFAQSQASKRPDGSRSSASAQEMLLKQSIDEIMGDELWQPSISDPGNMPALPFENSENMRKIEPSRAVKLLPPADDSSRKQILGASASHTRKRRKVLLVDQPGQRTADKSTQAIKSVSNQSRPMSADDIQKAKMRAQYKQRNFGKTSSLNESNATKTEILHKPASTTPLNLSRSPVTKFPVRPKIEEQKKYSPLSQKLSNKLNDHIDLERKVDPKEPLDDLCNRVQIPWQTPPEVKLNDIWRVGTGESSKEVDVQKNRNKREMEILYDTILDIPSNPREPWDLEMDYDDTLTPEIPVEQQPDVDGSEMQPSNSDQIDAIPTLVPSLPQGSTGIASEPDLELLAALLKNPELVFALTSGQAGNLSSEETVRLLDMIKKGGLGVTTDSNGIGKKVEENVEVSLPSPTPANNPGTSGWRPDFAKNPFSRQSIAPTKVDYTDPGVPTIAAPLERHPSSIVGVPQQEASVSLLCQHLPAFVPGALHQTTALTHEKQVTGMMPSSVHPIHTNSSLQASVTEIVTPTRNSPAPNISALNFPSGIGPSRQREVANMAPSSMGSFTMDASERQQASFPYSPSIATPMQTPARPSQQQAQRIVERPSVTSSRIPGENLGPVSDSWNARQGLASNYHRKVKQTNFNVTYREPDRSQMRSGPPRERNQFDGDDGFESWSPENSPGRSPAQLMARRDYSGPSTNSRGEHMPGNRQPRPRYPSSHRDQNRDGNRRWR